MGSERDYLRGGAGWKIIQLQSRDKLYEIYKMHLQEGKEKNKIKLLRSGPKTIIINNL
jgi:hypothetical protein